MDYGDPYIGWEEANAANEDGQAVMDAEREAGERDYWQEYKDDLAMGRIYEDGTPRDPDPTDYLEQQAQEQHEDAVHGGGPCNCPPGEPLNPEPPGGYDDEPPF
jgi:hypothetical protein